MLCALVFAGSVAGLGVHYARIAAEDEVDREVAGLVAQAPSAPEQTPAQSAAPGGTAAPQESAPPQVLEKYAALYEANPDVIGWLRIDDTVIDYAVMQTPDDPEKYLHLDFYGKKSNRGTLFMEAGCDIFSSDNLIIYGHRMNSGAMFGDLALYKTREYWEAHRYIQFDTIYKEGTYEVVAAFSAQILRQDAEGFRYYRFYGEHTEAEFNEYRDFIAANRLYDTGTDIAYGDELLTLSTCAVSSGINRFVVVARRLPEEGDVTLTEDAAPFASAPEEASPAAAEEIAPEAVALSAAPVSESRSFSTDLTLISFLAVLAGTAALRLKKPGRRKK